jgi:hypothetical protein
MASFNSDNDMKKFRPNILDLGVDSWKTQREEAYSIICRAVDLRWYRKVAADMGHDWRETPFNADLILGDDLQRAGTFKSLELAYLYIKKSGEADDAHSNLEKEFRKLYTEEIDAVLAVGIDYDWDGSGATDWTEQQIYSSRRQMRV